MDPAAATMTTALSMQAGHIRSSEILIRNAKLKADHFAYSSWRLHHGPVSLRPLGARSSH